MVEDVLDLKGVEAQLEATHTTLEQHIEKANAELAENKNVSTETKNAVAKLSETATDLADRLAELEQKNAKRIEEGKEEFKSAGQTMVDSEEFANLKSSGPNGPFQKAKLEVKATVVNDYTGGMSQPLVAGDRLNMVWREPDRPLRIRDVLRQSRTDSNTIFFTKEDTFTNAAAHQTAGSPTVQTDETALAESSLTFTSATETVRTIGHFIPVSLQALEDSSFIKSQIDGRLMYGLKLKEETELLNGSGTVGTITGINNAATAYAQADSPESYTTNIDFIRDAIRQLEVANYWGDHVIVMNPKDWSDIELAKDSQGRYLFSNPQALAPARLWAKRVVVSNSQTAGTCVVFNPAVYEIFDRHNAELAVSYENSTNFQDLAATIRCYERLAFVNYSTAGAVKVTFA